MNRLRQLLRGEPPRAERLPDGVLKALRQMIRFLLFKFTHKPPERERKEK